MYFVLGLVSVVELLVSLVQLVEVVVQLVEDSIEVVVRWVDYSSH